MSNWWHTLASIGMAVLVAVTPAVQGTIGHHPVLGVVLGSLWAILGHILPSPMDPATGK